MNHYQFFKNRNDEEEEEKRLNMLINEIEFHPFCGNKNCN